MHRHTNELTAQDQPPGEIEIVAARLEIARGVIVEEQHAGSAVEQREAEKLRSIDRRLGPGAQGQVMDGEEAVASVEADLPDGADAPAKADAPAEVEPTDVPADAARPEPAEAAWPCGPPFVSARPPDLARRRPPRSGAR